MVKKIFEKGYLAIILAVLYAPIVLIMIYSFSDSANFTFAGGFSLNGYKEIFVSEKSEELWSALKNTFFIAGVSSVFATLIGAVAAVGVYSLGKRAKKAVESVNQLPIINSEIVMAVSLMIFFVTLKFPAGYLRLIIGHISFCAPYVVLSVMPKLISMDPNIYEAALDLGANPFKALVKVIFPLILPGVFSGFILSFTLSMDDFIITQINKGADTGIDTLSTYIYAQAARGQGLSSFWFALFTIIFILVLALVMFANLRAQITKNKNKQDVMGGNK